MSWWLALAGLAAAVLVAFVWLRIAALVAINRELKPHFAWSEQCPIPLSMSYHVSKEIGCYSYRTQLAGLASWSGEPRPRDERSGVLLWPVYPGDIGDSSVALRR